jgi:membrane carboxypeptidase/penicillin-binding protein PbpC
MRAGDACPLRTREWLPATSSPLPCDWHHHTEDGLLTLWPEPYRAWAAAKGLLEEKTTFAWRDGNGRLKAAPTPFRDAAARDVGAASRRPEAASAFGILSPADGATYLIDPTLRAEFQRLPLRATAGRGPVEWRIDNRVVATDAADVEWPLARGAHRVTARDASGRMAEAYITIK